MRELRSHTGLSGLPQTVVMCGCCPQTHRCAPQGPPHPGPAAGAARRDSGPEGSCKVKAGVSEWRAQLGTPRGGPWRRGKGCARSQSYPGLHPCPGLQHLLDLNSSPAGGRRMENPCRFSQSPHPVMVHSPGWGVVRTQACCSGHICEPHQRPRLACPLSGVPGGPEPVTGEAPTDALPRSLP